MKQPNFMCLGAPKCGSTTLYDILKNHSDIFLTSFKEPHFFDIEFNYEKGYKWYLSEYYSDVGNQHIVGEFTPSYLIMPNASHRIFREIGNDIKFIVLLRNPVDRAYSQYLHAKRDMIEDLSFEQSLVLEKERIAKFLKEKDDISYIRLSYIQGGLYYKLLRTFYDTFDKANFKIIIFEDEFMNNRIALLSEIYDFLNIRYQELNVDIKSNQVAGTRFPFVKKMLKNDSRLKRAMKILINSKKYRSELRNFLQRISNKSIEKETFSQTLRENIMNEYFIDDIHKLEKLINRDLAIWYDNGSNKIL